MFNLKGPSKKLLHNTNAFFVLDNESIIASLPQTKEVVLVDGKGKKKTFSRFGKEQGQINKPLGFSVDSKGRIFIADTGNSRIQIFNTEGGFDLNAALGLVDINAAMTAADGFDVDALNI